MSETVALSIVHDIVARGLTTGDRLPLEAEMLTEYRVSRSSLREALRILEVQGLISLKPGPGGGPVVGRVDARHLARTATLYFHLGGMTYGQLFETQQEFEPICAARACQHPDRRERLRPFMESYQAVPQGPDYHASTQEFHDVVYDLAANPVLALISKAVTQILTVHIISTMDPVDMHAAIHEEHQVLARTIVAGHANRARELTEEHFRRQHEYYLRRAPSRIDDLIEWR
ncbi:MAG: FadR family transcriptional regulator [Acidobacteriota bacterium]|nr:FadR family transcriptional regulator [Acidobacteriota bacterium]